MVKIIENGKIHISAKNSKLNFSVDNGEHSLYYVIEKRPGTDIYKFDVPKWFHEMVEEYLIDQKYSRNELFNQHGMAPILNDISTPGKCIEFLAPWIQEYATNGRIIKNEEIFKK